MGLPRRRPSPRRSPSARSATLFARASAHLARGRGAAPPEISPPAARQLPTLSSLTAPLSSRPCRRPSPRRSAAARAVVLFAHASSRPRHPLRPRGGSAVVGSGRGGVPGQRRPMSASFCPAGERRAPAGCGPPASGALQPAAAHRRAARSGRLRPAAAPRHLRPSRLRRLRPAGERRAPAACAPPLLRAACASQLQPPAPRRSG
jgi:hypothetical protein